jgi:glutamyl endopeptidase
MARKAAPAKRRTNELRPTKRAKKPVAARPAKPVKPSTPTGPHTPISNVASEATAAGRSRVSPPSEGDAEGVLEAAEHGVEAIRSTVVMEAAAAAPVAPNTENLRDIGAASFRDPDIVLEAVHGVDNRIKVTETNKYPFRLNASLLITARDGSQWVGTAWFISPRTLITAGHCVYIKNSGVHGRDGWVKSIQVMPGRNGSALPYGSVTSTQFCTVKGWADTGDENYDYAAIIIPTDVGSIVGVIGFGSYPDGELTGAVANVTGYPGDKPSGTMWYDTKGIATVNASKVYYDIDTAGGQSGAAVYVIKGGQRIAVAIHAYGGAVTNSGTRISTPVFQNLTNWKA